MGLALGCIGMSMDDFCRCTPSEFRAVYGGWRDMAEGLRREAWERTRMECLCSLQPYSKKRLAAEDIMRFAWDDAEDGREDEEKKSLRTLKSWRDTGVRRLRGGCENRGGGQNQCMWPAHFSNSLHNNIVNAITMT